MPLDDIMNLIEVSGPHRVKTRSAGYLESCSGPGTRGSGHRTVRVGRRFCDCERDFSGSGYVIQGRRSQLLNNASINPLVNMNINPFYKRSPFINMTTMYRYLNGWSAISCCVIG